MNSGVYCIRHRRKPTDSYIGITWNLSEREAKHRWMLANGKHPSALLSACFDPYDAEDFIFDILEQCEPGDADCERRWVEKLKPTLNVRLTARNGKPVARSKRVFHPHTVRMMVDESVYQALVAYRDQLNVSELSVSDATRDLTIKALERAGLLS